MDVLIVLALIGLFVFLGFLYKQNQHSTASFDQLVRLNMDLEQQLIAERARAAQTELLQAQLDGYRQATQTMVSSEEYEMRKTEVAALSDALQQTKEELDIVKGKQISSSVRLGQISEHIVGLLPDFPLDMKGMRFLGSPIDYVAFDFTKEEIVFIEVKTGESKLTDKQRKVRDWVSQGKVKFMQVRISNDGVEYE